MSKLLVPGTQSWYDELNTIAFYRESDFEMEISNHVCDIFPDYISIPFKYAFTSDKYPGSKEPDILIIKNDLTEWWITEVELSNHPIKHIIDQISIFSSPKFNALILADYIHERIEKHHPNFQVTSSQVHNMIVTYGAKVLVIIDEYKAKLRTELKKYKALLCIFQMFKDSNGNPAYRLEGEYPRVVHADSHCRLASGVRMTLEVCNPQIIDHIADKSDIELFIRGKKTTWRKVESKKATYLLFAGREIFPLNGTHGYVLELSGDNKFHLQKTT